MDKNEHAVNIPSSLNPASSMLCDRSGHLHHDGAGLGHLSILRGLLRTLNERIRLVAGGDFRGFLNECHGFRYFGHHRRQAQRPPGTQKVITVCTFLLVAGYLLMAVIHSTWQFYVVYGVILAAGVAGYGLRPWHWWPTGSWGGGD